MLTKETLTDFIMRQPDNRIVEMHEASSDYDCGCVLVQFGREELGADNFSCGIRSLRSGDELIAMGDDWVRHIIGELLSTTTRPLNYGLVKQIVKEAEDE